MKAIILVHSDRAKYLLFVKPISFDTQAWANEHRASLKLLQVVRVIEEVA